MRVHAGQTRVSNLADISAMTMSQGLHCSYVTIAVSFFNGWRCVLHHSVYGNRSKAEATGIAVRKQRHPGVARLAAWRRHGTRYTFPATHATKQSVAQALLPERPSSLFLTLQIGSVSQTAWAIRKHDLQLPLVGRPRNSARTITLTSPGTHRTVAWHGSTCSGCRCRCCGALDAMQQRGIQSRRHRQTNTAVQNVRRGHICWV